MGDYEGGAGKRWKRQTMRTLRNSVTVDTFESLVASYSCSLYFADAKPIYSFYNGHIYCCSY